MQLSLDIWRSARSIGAAAGIALCVAGASVSMAASPFTSLEGNWSGGGQIRLDGGQTERLKCTAYYRQKDGGAALSIAIRCASQNNKIELRANLIHQGGKLSGTWEERTFNAAGDVTGQASDNRISLSISGGGLSGSMVVSFTPSSQRVSITTQGTGLKGVSINLSR
jgi:hypothetical protein